MQTSKIGVAVVGCGLIGTRRAEEAANHPQSELRLVVDMNAERATSTGKAYRARAATDWREVLADDSIDVVVVATPHGSLCEISVAALDSAKHVLMEKPMGRNLAEAARMVSAAERSGKLLKVGFNHRYHPALIRMHELFTQGRIGALVNIRARYGHGGRPGYEREWRGNAALAGGGELTDQGVHLLDLIHWFAGFPQEGFAYMQTAVWPIAPLEDNAFALFRFPRGPIASLHSSWTQWKNLFSFELFGTAGSLAVEGLGKSYGVEKLTLAQRNPAGGMPKIEEFAFDGPDRSWEFEWHDFMRAIIEHAPYQGNPDDGFAVMQMLSALYESVRRQAPVQLEAVSARAASELRA